MELTQNFLRGKNPCAMGYRWFVRNNLAGGDYQAAMDTQVAAGRVEDARWLLENFGSTNSVLELEHLEADNFVYAGTLIVHGDVRVPGQLLVGRSLEAGGGIRAGKLEAGEEIQCGGAIFAGELLQAGGSIKAAWSVEVQGEVRAEDLRCGWELRGGGHVKLKGNAHIGQEVQVQGDMHCGKGLKAGGAIEVQGLLDVGHGIAGNDGILCGNHIQAGWGIKAQADSPRDLQHPQRRDPAGRWRDRGRPGLRRVCRHECADAGLARLRLGARAQKARGADQRLLGRPAGLRLDAGRVKVQAGKIAFLTQGQRPAPAC
ncbi:hypothetical protein [Comamonas thiooxydans]|uniref:hypothetical protein n=1 Tax=Comamonas thiooxydans TaxID=363952 RepID=UPI001ED8E247|nr:hypothetical protein [Comamonas thiooxydans]